MCVCVCVCVLPLSLLLSLSIRFFFVDGCVRGVLCLLPGAGVGLVDLIRVALLQAPLTDMHLAAGTHAWWLRARLHDQLHPTNTTPPHAAEPTTTPTPHTAQRAITLDSCPSMLAFNTWEDDFCERQTLRCHGDGAGAASADTANPATANTAAAAPGNNFIVVHNTFFVLERRTDVERFFSALEELPEDKNGMASGYAQAQAALLDDHEGGAALQAQGIDHAGICLGSIAGFKLVGEESRSPQLPASCILSQLCAAARAAQAAHALVVLPLWSEAICHDQSNHVQVCATAEVVAGLCQMVQGSFLTGSSGRCYGAHKQLGARQGSRGRNF